MPNDGVINLEAWKLTGDSNMSGPLATCLLLSILER